MMLGIEQGLICESRRQAASRVFAVRWPGIPAASPCSSAGPGRAPDQRGGSRDRPAHLPGIRIRLHRRAIFDPLRHGRLLHPRYPGAQYPAIRLQGKRHPPGQPHQVTVFQSPAVRHLAITPLDQFPGVADLRVGTAFPDRGSGNSSEGCWLRSLPGLASYGVVSPVRESCKITSPKLLMSTGLGLPQSEHSPSDVFKPHPPTCRGP